MRLLSGRKIYFFKKKLEIMCTKISLLFSSFSFFVSYILFFLLCTPIYKLIYCMNKEKFKKISINIVR